jgi:alkyl hydroperoxide reductase subunit AhpC
LLGDATGEVSAVYGMWDPLVSDTRAGIVVVDRKGMIRLVVSGQILPPEEVLSLTSITIQGS